MNKKSLRLFFFFTLFTTFLSAQISIPEACSVGFIEPAEDCWSACVNCNLVPFVGSTGGFTPSPMPYCPGFTINNDQWFGFVAGASSITFTVTPYNCTLGDGVQVAVYAVGCNDGPIACNGGCGGCGTTPQSVTASLIPGNVYYLLIDGYNGDECDFQVTFSPPVAAQAPTIGTTSNIAGPSTTQSGATVTYSIPSVANASFYTWSSSVPGVLFNGFEGPVTFVAPGGRSVAVTFPSGYFGNSSICVQPSNLCFTGTQICKTVNVFSFPPTVLPKAVVCNEDVPYILPWGDEVYTSGTYSTVLTSYLGADSVVSQMVQFLPMIITNTTKYICEGDTINVCGTKYFKQGLYSEVCTSYRGCDSLVNLTLNVLAPKAKILGNGFIGCEQTNIVLKSIPSFNFPGVSIKKWTRPDGSTQTGDTLLVSTAGTYKLCTTMNAGGNSCSICDSIFVIRDSLAIPIIATSGLVGCTVDSLKINTSGVQVAQPIYQWSGPNNFSSALAAPVVYNAGNYTVTVTTAAGCSGTASAVVLQGTGQSSITANVTGGPITCFSTSFVTISATTTAPSATFLWSGPNNFYSNLPSPTATVAGTYTVIVTDTLGCSNTANVIVAANIVPPVINTTSVQTLDCGNSFMLSATTTGSGLTYIWEGPGGIYVGSSVNVPYVSDYKLVVTDTLNGCTSTSMVFASAPLLPIIFTNAIYPPTVGENNGAIDIALNYQTGVTVNWSANGNLLAITEDLSNLPPGTYNVLVTTNTGCTTTQTYTLTAASPVVFCTPSQNISAVETCGANNCNNCNLHNYIGTTSGWVGDPNPPGWCSQVQNDQWLPFVAGAPNATITVTPSNCTTGNGIQFAVYPSACGSLPVACSEGCAGCGNTPIALTVNLIPGQTYYLVIDGFSQDECDFKVTASPAIALAGLALGNMSAISGDAVTCPNSNSIYSINTVLGADQYTWSSPTPGILFNGQPSPAVFAAPLGTTVQVSFPANNNGAITICTQAANACNTSVQQCKSVNIVPIIQVLPTQTICASELPFNLPWGATAVSAGIYSSVLQAANGCDSTVQQQIVVLNPIADILGNNVIGCGMSSIELQSASSLGSSKIWSNLATGLQLGTGNNLSINQAGTYVLVVQNAANGKICAATDTVTVVTDSTIIVVMANGGVVGCTSDSLALSSSVAISNIQYAWTGPGGFQSNLPSPIVTEAGDYTLLVSNAQGCNGTATASVAASDGPPPIVVSATVITCVAPLAQLSASSTFNNVNYAWGGPSGFQSNVQNPETAIGGNYTVTVSDQLGCTNTATQTVILDNTAPPINITPSNAPCVGVDMLTANTTNAGMTPTYLWTGPGGVTSNSATIEVDTAGIYTVIVTNTTNGCTTIQTQNAIHGNFTPQVTLNQLVNPSNGLNNGSINITVSGGFAPYSYTWSTGGLVASTSEDAFFLVPGDYICYITGADSCTTTVTYTLTNTVSTQDIADQNQWAIQPNPSTGIFYLTNKNGAQSPSALRVFDVLGRSVWSTPSTMPVKEMAIDLTQMPNGVYWLEIEQAAKYGGRTYKKLVVAR